MASQMERQYLSFQIRGEKADQDQVSATIAVCAEHEIFREHFPEEPIVPGAFLASLAINIAAQSLPPERRQSVHIDQITFVRPIRPGDYLAFSAKKPDRAAETGRFSFALSCDDGVSCRGKLAFAGAGDHR